MKPFRYAWSALETRGAIPAYGGWVLIGLTLCFWIAAANTMAGWLYVLSGMGAALLALAATLPMQALKDLEITRSPLVPIHFGETLSLSLTLRNNSRRSKGLLLAKDLLPPTLGNSVETAIDAIAPQGTYTWTHRLEPRRRGFYQWDQLVLRTGAPLGLFWSRRLRTVPAELWVYPMVFPLTHCPILDQAGPAARQTQLQETPFARAGQEGSTRSLRPYRAGDPMRLVHWRSSARFNELRVRELEWLNGGQTCAIAIDTQCIWHPDHFEQAVIAAASLYLYAVRHYGSAQLWTAQWGTLQERQPILQALAQIEPHPKNSADLPTEPAIWLTTDAQRVTQFPPGSRYILWSQTAPEALNPVHPRSSNPFGFSVNLNVPIQVQLQQPLSAHSS
ncbi:MAG: DUF58 domain-containing protein [Thermosynechococcaceae cyanobacterium]